MADLSRRLDDLERWLAERQQARNNDGKLLARWLDTQCLAHRRTIEELSAREKTSGPLKAADMTTQELRLLLKYRQWAREQAPAESSQGES